MTKYPELNRFGLTEYHHQRLCYPYTAVPAFTFWDPPTDDVLPEMRAWQDNRCGLCGFREPWLVEDHCHDSGLVRGMLCRSCNASEGHSDRNLEQWRGGVTVAAYLGIEKQYVNIFRRTPLRLAPATDAELDAIALAVTADDM